LRTTGAAVFREKERERVTPFPIRKGAIVAIAGQGRNSPKISVGVLETVDLLGGMTKVGGEETGEKKERKNHG